MTEPAGGTSGVGGPTPGPGPLRRVPLVNVANALTVLRIGLVPLFVIFMIASEMTRPGYRIAAAWPSRPPD